MLNGLDLFSGIGGMSIALNEWIRPLAYCEIDPYCQGILLSQMVQNRISHAPIWDDIRTFRWDAPRELIDIVYGGFPCQDISIAKVGKGLEGDRSGLFSHIVRLAKEIEPSFLFLENVPAITTRGGLQVVKEIAEAGYDCRWCTLSASQIGAPHKRERWFLLAYTQSKRFEKERFAMREKETFSRSRSSNEYENGNSWWKSESTVDRMADGIRQRSHRIKALGNSVVPQQAKEAFQYLMGLL